ncbi:MAG: hypothetical protein A3K19_10195 [Lentisphaerae bacterium RIFOXYB12_FULL_65_16]|nr:MAG: hypothetical protein A3K19_10195 [Lentisphaerae bacterium RIFOXYB12_FULL_65_16]
MDKPPVYVTGMGLVSCLGAGVAEVFARMCRGECGMRPIDRFPAAVYAQPKGGQIEPALEQRLREEFPDEDLAAGVVKAAGREALRQAGAWTETVRVPAADFGLVLATNFGPMETLEWCWRERVEVGTLDAKTFAHFDQFVENVAAWLGCGGPRVQLSLSCASGAAAVALAKDWIQAGRCRRVLAIGYDMLTEFCWCGLSNLRTISTDAIRPFDARRSGTIFSEGAAAMLLELGGNSGAGGVRLARVAGGATNNNAYHMTAPPKEAEGTRRVMAAALADAGLAPESIDHICAHATATVANDTTETAAFHNLFGERLKEMTVAAHKSQLGHMMGAAGLAEAIVTVEVLRQHVIPPTINHEQRDPGCLVDCIPGKARARAVKRAITSSAGIGGNNSALVLESVE